MKLTKKLLQREVHKAISKELKESGNLSADHGKKGFYIIKKSTGKPVDGPWKETIEADSALEDKFSSKTHQVVDAKFLSPKAFTNEQVAHTKHEKQMEKPHRLCKHCKLVSHGSMPDCPHCGTAYEIDGMDPLEEEAYNREEDGVRKTTTFGEIPDEDELYDLMDGDSYDMNLQGADDLAWEYAMQVSPDPQAGSMSAGAGLHASLEALVNVPDPEGISDEDYENVERLMDRWTSRYGDESIVDAAWSLASSIVDTLGIEWI